MIGGRHTRGASALMAVLLVGVLAGGALLAWHTIDDVERRRGAAKEDGRVFAMWLEAAHRASMRRDYRAALVLDPDGFGLALSTLAGAPPGLPGRTGLSIGVMDDGAGVPMAWAVLVVDESRRAWSRLGALGAGLAAVGVGGVANGPMSDREAAVGAARGAGVPPGSLFATADRGLVYQDEAVFRRAQPGRPWANVMDEALDMDGHDVAGGGSVEAGSGVAVGDVEAGGVARIEGDVSSATLNAGGLLAESVSAGSAFVNAGLFVGSLDVANLLRGERAGGVPVDVTASGRVEGGFLTSLGSVDAGLLVSGGPVSVGGALTVRGGVDAQEMEAVAAFNVAAGGTVSARVVGAGNMNAGSLGVPIVSLAGDVFGPAATISGRLTVGSCEGC